jgi:ubiquinone/menaquinone biosynthesis C-methylase UbiE
MHVLQYVPDDRQGIAELFRVMKPGAWAMVQVPMRVVTFLSKALDMVSPLAAVMRSRTSWAFDSIAFPKLASFHPRG